MIIRYAFSVVFVLIISFFNTGCGPAAVRYVPGEIPEWTPAESEIQQVSEKNSRQLLTQVPVVQDSISVKRIEHVLSRLLAVTPASTHWKAYILNVPDWNAMVSPDQRIFVFYGLLSDLKDDNELAAVLAHEISHRLAHHEVKRSEQKLGAILAEIAGIAIANEVASDPQNSQEDAVAIGKMTAKLVAGMAVLPHSQGDELEADQIGLFLMADAGFNPSAAIALWQKQAAKDGNTPEFFNTHPASGRRAEVLKQLLPQAQQRYQEGLKNIAAKTKMRVTISKEGELPHRASAKAYAYSTAGFQAIQNYQFDEAREYFSQATKLDRQYADPLVGLAYVDYKQGLIDSAHTTLLQATKVERGHGNAHYNLACVQAIKGERANALKSLKRAISIDGTLRQTARGDADLLSLQNDPTFISLTSAGAQGGSTFSINVW